MKQLQASLVTIVILSSALAGIASSQEPTNPKKDYGPCFQPIEQKTFDEAEKEVKTTAAFGIGRSSPLPKIFRGGFHHPEDKTNDISVFFPPIDKLIDFSPGMLLRIVLVGGDGTREAYYFESKGRLDSLKSESGKKIVTSHVDFYRVPPTRPIGDIEVTALTMPLNGSRKKYTGTIPEDNGG